MHERFHIAVCTRLLHDPVHIGAHAGVGLEVPLHIFFCLGHRYADILREGEGGDAVDDAEVHGLGTTPHLRRHVLRLDVEHARRRQRVEVLARAERPAHGLVARDVREQAQLDLRIVGVDEDIPRRGDEHPAHLAAELGACGDVLQVRLGRREPPRRRHRHLKARADAPVGADGLQKPVGIGALELGVLPVLQHVRHDRHAAQLIEHVRVCAPAGLGFFAVRELHVLEEDLPELLGGVDVEGRARGGVDLLLKLRDRGLQRLAELGERRTVDEKAALLHPGEHRAQRQLDVVVERLELQLAQLRRERLAERRDRRRIAQQRRRGRRAVAKHGKRVRLEVDGPR